MSLRRGRTGSQRNAGLCAFETYSCVRSNNEDYNGVRREQTDARKPAAVSGQKIVSDTVKNLLSQRDSSVGRYSLHTGLIT